MSVNSLSRARADEPIRNKPESGPVEGRAWLSISELILIRLMAKVETFIFSYSQPEKSISYRATEVGYQKIQESKTIKNKKPMRGHLLNAESFPHLFTKAETEPAVEAVA